MEKYAQRKILFRDTKWFLSNTSYRGRDDQAVWACAVGRTTWPLHCQLAPWKSNEALSVYCGRRVWNLLKSTEAWSFSMTPSDFHLFGPTKEHLRGQKFEDDDEVMAVVQSWLKATPKSFFWRASASLWTGGPSVLRSRGTMLKNKTQTISMSILVKKLLRI